MLFNTISFYLFIWFLLFYFDFIKYNPLYTFLLYTFILLFILIYMFYIQATSYNITKFIIINLFIKIIPIFLILHKTNWNLKINKEDIYFGIFITLLYLLFYNYRLINIYTKIFSSYFYNKKEQRTFVSVLYDNIFMIYNK